MVDLLAYAIIVSSLLYAAWALVAVVLGQNPREPFVIGAAVIELLVLVQAVVAIVLMIAGDGPTETALFVSYLLFAAILLPVGLFWALAEKSRWGTAVLVFTALVLPALVVRLQDIWDGIQVGG